MAGHAPGGGGGGGAFDTVSGAYHGGFPGGAGKVELVYTPAAAPANNVIRFLLFVPKHGGNSKPGPVRAPTGGPIHPPHILFPKDADPAAAGRQGYPKGHHSRPAPLFPPRPPTPGD